MLPFLPPLDGRQQTDYEGQVTVTIQYMPIRIASCLKMLYVCGKDSKVQRQALICKQKSATVTFD